MRPLTAGEANTLSKLERGKDARYSRRAMIVRLFSEPMTTGDLARLLNLSIPAIKCPKVAECLKKDRAELLAFYDFPAQHWVHIRTAASVRTALAG